MAGSFEDLLVDLFAPLGGVSLRKMFGGIGVFKDAVMFGLVEEGALYLRTDGVSEPRFAAEGSAQFVYMGMKGRAVAMPYFRLPERLYDEPEAFARWSEMAFAAAGRAAAQKAGAKQSARTAAAKKKPPARASANRPRGARSAKKTR